MTWKRQENSIEPERELRPLNLPKGGPGSSETSDEVEVPAQVALNYLKTHSILLLVLGAFLYHQNSVMSARDREFRDAIREREQQLMKLMEADKQRFLDREADLVRQRDELFRLLREETSKNAQIIRVREQRWTRPD